MAHTLGFRRKYDMALHHVENFLAMAKRPVIACGGGKDSTAAAILARRVDPRIPIVCGDPPNPLSDREAHIIALASWLGGSFLRVPYAWDVRSVLDGQKPYPESLKMKVLAAWHKAHGVDGVIFGLRSEESRSRQALLRWKGAIYAMKAGWRCCPVGQMSAEEVLCVALLHDAPINPVYSRQKGNLNFNLIRDGTWWPHGYTDISGWVREYYPEHYEDHIRAGQVYDAHKSRICQY